MEMGRGDATNACFDSTDMYSRVKLRALNKKVCRVENDVFADGDGKTAYGRPRRTRTIISQSFLSENVAANMEISSMGNAFAEKSRLRTLTEVTEKETDGFYSWRSENEKLNDQLTDVQHFDKLDLVLDEGTALEMLDALRRGRPKTSSNSSLENGDLVWGRVKSYPWWPGQIFDEALASPLVHSEKKEGAILVAFYGDYTYAWLDPQDIIPFHINFSENLKQTNVQMFLTAVEEAITDIKTRVALAFVCHCQNHFDLQPIIKEGNSIKQIQRARESFRPEEIIYVLKHLAISPRKNGKQNPYWIKIVANYFAYRKAVVKEINETYAQDSEAQKESLECPSGIMKENQKASQAPCSGLLDAEAPVEKTKGFKQLEVHDLQNKYPPNVSHGCLSRKYFEDHVLLIKHEESKFSGQEGPYDLHLVSEKRRVVESEIHSGGLVTSPRTEGNMGDIPKDSREHSSNIVPSSEAEVISHQLKSSPSRIFPVNTSPNDASVNLFSSSKPLQEQFRSNDLTNAGHKRRISGCTEDSSVEKQARLNKMKSLARLAGESQGIRSDTIIQCQKNSQIKQKSIRRDVIERMLTIKFPPQTMLPSVSEVKAKFACFGPLDEYSTRFLWKSSVYQLVFLYKSDAEAAYHHAIQNTTLFSTSDVRYYLQASGSGLNESCNALGLAENPEIQPATSLSSNEYTGEQMSVSFQSSLLQEKNQVKSSVKVSAEGSDCLSTIGSKPSETSTGSFEITKETTSLSLPSKFPLNSKIICSKNEPSGIHQFVEATNMAYHQAEATKNNDSQNTTDAKSNEISHELINLLSNFCGILGELKASYDHMF